MGDGVGGHWLLRMEWRPARWSVCLPLLIFPCTTKSRSSPLAPAHPGRPGKRAVKRLWWWWLVSVSALMLSVSWQEGYLASIKPGYLFSEDFPGTGGGGKLRLANPRSAGKRPLNGGRYVAYYYYYYYYYSVCVYPAFCLGVTSGWAGSCRRELFNFSDN